MNHIDIFNGDADGIFSLIQLRKTDPAASQTLITGVKRDQALLKNLTDDKAVGAEIQVLDLSFDKNADELHRVLKHAESVLYCDHHRASKLFEHSRLKTVINTDPTVCTGLLVSEMLSEEQDNKYHDWAIAAAFGDGLDKVAYAECKEAGYNDEQAEQLRNLGVFVNYNGYGARVEDLNYTPDELYKLLIKYDSPFDVVNDPESPYQVLEDGYHIDMARAEQSDILKETSRLIAVQLEDKAWARRVSGVYGTKLAQNNPDKAVVIATRNADSSLTISLRAPRNNLHGAGELCSRYQSGGGRAGAGGINKLETHHLQIFIAMVEDFYQK